MSEIKTDAIYMAFRANYPEIVRDAERQMREIMDEITALEAEIEWLRRLARDGNDLRRFMLEQTGYGDTERAGEELRRWRTADGRFRRIATPDRSESDVLPH